MSEELIIEQPSNETGNWLNPKERLGHLVAFFDVTSKVARYDEKAKMDKDVAQFRFVDLDGECEMLSGVDNHDGITRQLKPGNIAAVLGHVGTVKTKADNDFFVITEHTEEDSKRLQAWYADWKAGKDTRKEFSTAKAPPKEGKAETNGLDLSKLDPTTLALIQQQLAAAQK